MSFVNRRQTRTRSSRTAGADGDVHRRQQVEESQQVLRTDGQLNPHHADDDSKESRPVSTYRCCGPENSNNKKRQRFHRHEHGASSTPVRHAKPKRATSILWRNVVTQKFPSESVPSGDDHRNSTESGQDEPSTHLRATVEFPKMRATMKS